MCPGLEVTLGHHAKKTKPVKETKRFLGCRALENGSMSSYQYTFVPYWALTWAFTTVQCLGRHIRWTGMDLLILFPLQPVC